MTTIAVIGGTGYAGSSIVREAASRGHRVIALSRSQPADPVEGVRYLQGSLADAGRLVEEADVVVGALSPRGEMAGKLVEAYAELARLADAAGRRLVVIGGFSSLRPAPGAPRFVEGDDLPPQHAAEAKEMNAVLGAIAATPQSLDWLFVSPAAGFGAYAPGEPRGSYRLGGEVALFDDQGQSAVSGPDFALAVVDEIEKASQHRAHVSVAY